MFFFNKKEEMKISPYEKEQKINQVLSMFPLLSRDHFLYSTLERNNWSLDSSIINLQRRHEYLEAEQYQIERRLEENRIKKEHEQRERERDLRLVAQVRDIFGSKFSDHQIKRVLYDNRNNVESTINYFMREVDQEQYRERQKRQQRLDEEDRLQRQRERDEYERHERNKKRVNDLLLEIKYSSPEQKRQLAQSKLFQDVLKDFDHLNVVDQPPPPPPQIKTIYVPVPQPMVQPQPRYFNNFPTTTTTTNTSSFPPSFSPPDYNSSLFGNNNNDNKPSKITTPQPFQNLDPFCNSTTITPFSTNPFFVDQNSTPGLMKTRPEERSARQLKELFPNTSDEVIRYVLLSTDNNMPLAIQNLLDITIKVENSKNASN
ncbi:hypothetical protein RB653_002189 [Dictyostelium firmibasis]|uniref:CUE domain-containing protein n=1 Tax=Dictyostelium firmibasis TaxID=79012 RepID=A0AAN7YMT3_9MYCE